MKPSTIFHLKINNFIICRFWQKYSSIVELNIEFLWKLHKVCMYSVLIERDKNEMNRSLQGFWKCAQIRLDIVEAVEHWTSTELVLRISIRCHTDTYNSHLFAHAHSSFIQCNRFSSQTHYNIFVVPVRTATRSSRISLTHKHMANTIQCKIAHPLLYLSYLQVLTTTTETHICCVFKAAALKPVYIYVRQVSRLPL